MNEEMARDLARQLREHISYTGDVEQFDKEILILIKHVENQCAIVVETAPDQIFLMGNPRAILASAIRKDF